MSKGLGKTQRLVLDALRAHRQYTDVCHRSLGAQAIAHFRVCDGVLEYQLGRARDGWKCKKCGGPHKISLAETESLRRAIRALANAGLVVTRSYPVLRARLPFTDEEREEDTRMDVELERYVAALKDLVSSANSRR